jgi:hypothetical protein
MQKLVPFLFRRLDEFLDKTEAARMTATIPWPQWTNPDEKSALFSQSPSGCGKETLVDISMGSFMVCSRHALPCIFRMSSSELLVSMPIPQ